MLEEILKLIEGNIQVSFQTILILCVGYKVYEIENKLISVKSKVDYMRSNGYGRKEEKPERES